ncbi:MAG: class II fumarate hydratase [Planctomycetota bacterium]
MATTATPETRTEKDALGALEVPADVLYGASTQRAVDNFPSFRPVPDAILRAYVLLKRAAAEANNEIGWLEDERARLIAAACDRLEAGLPGDGGLGRHFPVDVFQTGSGTSTNNNFNEVIANLVCRDRTGEIGGSKDKAYIAAGGVHPNDHVNLGQSSNDTFPTAIHVAAVQAIARGLLPELGRLAAALEAKADAFRTIVKSGRTHLMDATPIGMGQVFGGYARQARLGEDRLRRALDVLAELPIGGTAVGTGIETHERFGALVAAKLADATGCDFREAADHCEAQHAKDAVVEASGHLRTLAVSLTKIANDIRWMGSGPRCGLGELRLPEIQPGSSIMPGKVNPVICESVVMACCQVLGNDRAIEAGGLGGIGSILDLNVAMPMMAANLLDSIDLLEQSCRVFREKLIEGLEAHADHCEDLAKRSSAVCTGLKNIIGYEAAGELAVEALESKRNVVDVAVERITAEWLAERKVSLSDSDRARVLDEAGLRDLLDPKNMIAPSR